MGKIKGLLGRFQNILLALLIISWQVVFAGAPFFQPGTASAATLSNTDVSISSKAFGIDHNSKYSVVNGQPTGAGSISNGNVGVYPEGACIPVVFDVKNTSNSTGDTTVSPVFDYYNNGIVGIQNYELITYNGSGNPETTATDLSQFTYSGQPLSTATSFKTTTGTTINATVSGPYAGNDAGTTAIGSTDAFRHYNVALTGIPAGATVQVLTCGRLGLDASQYPGASLSFRTVQGGQENLAIPVNQILTLPSITVTKTISAGTALPSDFSFDIAPNPNNGLGTHYTIPSGQNTVTIPNVNPDGTYTITEAGPAGYTFTGGSGASCSAVQASIGTAAGQMTATVAAGTTGNNATIVNATCTFTNSVQKGSITITKDAIPNSAQDFSFTATGSGVGNFSLDDDSDPTLSNTKTFTDLLPGTYSFTEGTVSGWEFDSISGCSGTGIVKNGSTVTITLAAGQNVSCTYTNRQRGHIVVHKVTNPANDPTGFSITASGSGNIAGSATQTLSTSQDVTYDVAQGTYAVSEDLSGTPGWHMDSNTCSNLVINGNTPLVNGVPTVTCTITNTKLAKLKIVKATNPASSTQSFSFSATGPSITQGNSSFVLDTNGADNTYPDNFQYSDLTPGAYSITETEPSGWTLTGLTCNGITYTWPGNTQTLNLSLPAGADVTCTYTNAQYGSISGYKYEVNADSSHVGTLSGWTITLKDSGNNVIGTQQTGNDGSFVFNNLLAGSYTIWETLQNGWTQIFSPSGVNLSAGQTSTNNNFGNFQNASISGYKFNDLNGNGTWNQPAEPGLQGWTITLYDNGGSGALLNHQVAQTTTAAGGSYSFTNLPPTTYKVCETQQTGWTQTYPDNTGCQNVNVTLSGHNYSGTNFGNQGRGTLTVIKNVDTDGNGTVDQTDVTNWTWGYSGTYGSGSNISTGSSNHQSVAAGSYTVSENQKTDYHVTASSCSNEPDSIVTTSYPVTVSPGEDVTCTFTNTRDTGTITVIKDLLPSSDTGKFNLQIDGVTKAANVGDGGTTNAVTVATGSHSVAELAGTSTSFDSYNSSYSCVNNQTNIKSGSGTSSGNFSVAYGDNIVCTFTNVRLGTISGYKFNDINGNGTWDKPGETGLEGWTIDLYQKGSLIVSQSTTTDSNGYYHFDNLQPGDYTVCEETQTGWNDIYPNSTGCQDVTINLVTTPGQVASANFGNQGYGTITVVKNVNDGLGHTSTDVSGWTWGYNGTLGTKSNIDAGSTNDQTVAAGSYTVSENQKTDYHFTSVVCTDNSQAMTVTQNESVSVTVEPGHNIVCTYTNTRDTGTITVVKKLNPTTDTGKFNLNIIGDTNYTATDQGNNGTTGTQTVVTGIYSVSETAGTGTSLSNYESSYVCKDGEVTIASGNTTQSDIFNVGYGDHIICTFTNERHATITVIKNVDDGFGNVTQDVNTWTWGYDGESYDDHLNTGSTNTQEVVAGDYSIWENTQDNYHFTSVSCSNDAGAVEVDNSASFDTSLAPGENLTCTFLNTRDTGTITVHKILYPSTDSGLFNLQINGTSYATDVGDGGTTGKVKVITGDGYYVGETAGTNTSLDSYQTWYWCSNERTYGSGTTSDTFSIGSDQNINCYFENVRLGTLTGMKFNDLNGNGKKDQGEPGLKDWTIQLYECQQEVFALNINSVDQVDGCVPTLLETTTTDTEGNYTFNNLPSGDYKVCEVQQVGWTQTAPDNTGCQEFNIYLDIEEGQPGQVVTKDFGNFQNGSISGFKFSDPNGNGKWDNGEPKLSGWTITLSKSDGNGGWTQLDSAVTDASGSYSFTDLPPADYQVCEVPQTGWIRISPKDSNCQVVSINQSGQTATALFANQKKVKPVVLALVNTGQNIMVGLYAGIVLLGLLGAVTWAAKKQ